MSLKRSNKSEIKNRSFFVDFRPKRKNDDNLNGVWCSTGQTWLSLLFPLQMSLRSASSPGQLRVYSLETIRIGSPVPPSSTSVPLTWSSCRRKTRRPSGVYLIQTLNKKCYFYRSNNNGLINKYKISNISPITSVFHVNWFCFLIPNNSY